MKDLFLNKSDYILLTGSESWFLELGVLCNEDDYTKKGNIKNTKRFPLSELKKKIKKDFDFLLVCLSQVLKSQQKSEKIFNCKKCIKKEDFCNNHWLYKEVLSPEDLKKFKDSFIYKKEYLRLNAV